MIKEAINMELIEINISEHVTETQYENLFENKRNIKRRGHVVQIKFDKPIKTTSSNWCFEWKNMQSYKCVHDCITA